MWHTFQISRANSQSQSTVQVSSTQENFLAELGGFPANFEIPYSVVIYTFTVMLTRIMLELIYSHFRSYFNAERVGAGEMCLHVPARCDVIARCLRMPKFSTSVHVGHLWRKVDVGPSLQQIDLFRPHAAGSVDHKGKIVSRNRQRL